MENKSDYLLLKNMKNRFGYFILLIFVFTNVGCKMENKPPYANNKIEHLIEKDLKNGVSKTKDIVLNIPNLPSKKYVSDRDHSSVSFRTKHWEIVDIIGWFTDFEIVMHSDRKDFSDAVIFARVYPKSIMMPNQKMMDSAQNHPYINSKEHPEMTFMSTNMELIGENTYKLHGTIQVNGVEKEMIFDVEFNGFAYPNEQSICGFDVKGKINRNDFNIGGDDFLHSGKMVHNDTINVHMALRME